MFKTTVTIMALVMALVSSTAQAQLPERESPESARLLMTCHPTGLQPAKMLYIMLLLGITNLNNQEGQQELRELNESLNSVKTCADVDALYSRELNSKLYKGTQVEAYINSFQGRRDIFLFAIQLVVNWRSVQK